MHLNKSSDKNCLSRGFIRPSLFDWCLDNGEALAISEGLLTDLLGVAPLGICAVAVDHKLVSQISFCYQQSSCYRYIVRTESGLGELEIQSIGIGLQLVFRSQASGKIKGFIAAFAITATMLDSGCPPIRAFLRCTLAWSDSRSISTGKRNRN